MSLSLLRNTVELPFMDAVQIVAEKGIALQYQARPAQPTSINPNQELYEIHQEASVLPGDSDDDKDGRRSAKLSAWTWLTDEVIHFQWA